MVTAQLGISLYWVAESAWLLAIICLWAVFYCLHVHETFLNTIAPFIVLGQRYRAIKESTFSTKTTVAVPSCGRNGSKSRLYNTMGDIWALLQGPNGYQHFMRPSSRCGCVEKLMLKDHAVCYLPNCVLLLNLSKVSNRIIGSIPAVILKQCMDLYILRVKTCNWILLKRLW